MAQRLSQIVECLWGAVISIDILQSGRKHLKRFRIQTAVLLETLASACPQLIEARSRPGHADDRHVEVTAPDHCLQRREDLLVRQIPGGAEEDKRI